MSLSRDLYKALSVAGDVRAASQGIGPFTRRVVRKKAHKSLAAWLRKAGI